MDKPAIHYDRYLGCGPEVREAIVKGLKGDESALRRELIFLRGFSPAGAQTMLSAYEYARCGQQAYCVGPRLQRMFAETAATGVPAQFFRMPHKCIYVATPGSPLELWGDEHTQNHPLGGFYIRQDEGVITFVLWGKENTRSRIPGDDATFWLILDLKKIPRTKDAAGTELLDFDTYIDTLVSDPSRSAHDLGLDIPDARKAEVLKNVPTAVRIGVNLILYLNSLKAAPHRDESGRNAYRGRQNALKNELGRTKNPAKRAKRERQGLKELASMSEAVIVWIGKSIEESPEPPAGTRRGGGGTWHARSGHWHHYWTGPRKNADGTWRTGEDGQRIYGDLLVLKWVAPVYRDMAEIVAARGRQHRFREEKADWQENPG